MTLLGQGNVGHCNEDYVTDSSVHFINSWEMCGVVPSDTCGLEVGTAVTAPLSGWLLQCAGTGEAICLSSNAFYTVILPCSTVSNFRISSKFQPTFSGGTKQSGIVLPNSFTSPPYYCGLWLPSGLVFCFMVYVRGK